MKKEKIKKISFKKEKKRRFIIQLNLLWIKGLH